MHDVWLADGDLVLRPMADEDLPQLLEWSNDPQVRYFSEGEGNRG